MEKAQQIIIDVVESNPKKIFIKFVYKKTYRDIAFIIDKEEDLPTEIGKRYVFIKKK